MLISFRRLLGVHVSRAMFFLVRRGRRWTCSSKIGFADVLVPNAFMTAHVSFKAGDENDEEEEEDWSRENDERGKGDGMLTTYGECLR